MAASWYMLITTAAKVESQYETYLTEARKYAEDGITKYAIQNYRMAMDVKNSPELYKEVAEYYKAQGKKESFYEWCEEFIEAYPEETTAYEYMLEAYLNEPDYEDCYELLDVIQNRNIKSEYITKVSEEIKYVYRTDINAYDEVGVYGNNYCPVSNDGSWGFVDRYGNLRIATGYTTVGVFTQSNNAPVVNKNGDAYYIDKSGSKVLVSKTKYESFGALINDVIAAKKTDGKYTYVNGKFEVLFGDYEYASAMNGSRAAVKKDGKWYIINEKGENVNSEAYLDVILDGKEIAYRNGRMFVSKDAGKYILVDESCKQVGSLTFEAVDMFVGEQPAAVKIDGKWKFIDKDGKLISDKSYDEAKSFSSGLAAVCVDGKWGFVDEAENLVIEAKFQGASYFTEKGSCFVQVDNNKWKLLKLYRLNRES